LNIEKAIRESIETKELLLKNFILEIEKIGKKLAESVRSGGKIMFCGNGGSAADSQHLAAELVIRYRSNVNRAAIPAIALTVDPSVITAGGNDIGFENVFARQLEAFGKPGDVLVGISTSGNSENVIRAMVTAKNLAVTTVGLLGGNGGKMRDLCDFSIIVPSKVTARIQESHILIGHIWCEIIEEELFSENL